MRRAIYPGSFDPLTNGHVDIIERSAALFDEVVVAILINPQKAALFTIDERLEMMRRALVPRLANVRLEAFHGLLVDFARNTGAHAIVRGIRAISDYEYESQMALMNRRLYPEVETVFLVPAEQYTYVSSRLVKEIAQLGGSVRGLVPEPVEEQLRRKLNP